MPKYTQMDLLVQAGINPKNGLPYKCSGTPLNTPVELVDGIKKQLSIVDRQDAVNRYVWYNLPRGLNSQMMERILYTKGSAVLFYMEGNETFYFLPFALDGSIDVYGRYTGITPLPYNGSNSVDGSDKEKAWIPGYTLIPRYDIVLPNELSYDEILKSCVIFKDYSEGISQTITPRKILSEPILDMMSECIPLLRTTLFNSTGQTGVVVKNEDEQDEVNRATLAMKRAALNGERWIPILGKLEMQELAAASTSKTEEFLLTMQSLDNYRLSLHGLNNGGLFQKRSQVLESEHRMNNGNSGILLQDGLINRQRQADIVNSLFGTSIYCEISETILDTDNNMDGYIDNKQDYSSEPLDTSNEEVESDE